MRVGAYFFIFNIYTSITKFKTVNIVLNNSIKITLLYNFY
nr:MAG TPA: hypothetical protein [Caudoviricetes sp.]